MKLVLLASEHNLYSNFLVREVLAARGTAVRLIIESTSLLPRKTWGQAFRKYLRRSGLAYVIAQASKQYIFRALALWLRVRKKVDHPLYPYRPFAAALGIPVVRSSDVHDAAVIAQIRGARPDLILSLLFNQILERDFLALAPHCWNFHPALLPLYRGVSPVFWALSRGEAEVGATLHEVAPRLDAGSIVAQARLEVRPSDSEHTLYLRATREGAGLVLAALKDLEAGRLSSRSMALQEGSYFSIPTRDAVRAFRRRGRRFWRLRELVRSDAAYGNRPS